MKVSLAHAPQSNNLHITTLTCFAHLYSPAVLQLAPTRFTYNVTNLYSYDGVTFRLTTQTAFKELNDLK